MAKTLAQELTEAADATAESWHSNYNVEKENQPVIVGEELVF